VVLDAARVMVVLRHGSRHASLQETAEHRHGKHKLSRLEATARRERKKPVQIWLLSLPTQKGQSASTLLPDGDWPSALIATTHGSTALHALVVHIVHKLDMTLNQSRQR
jgi:hypothetical protein